MNIALDDLAKLERRDVIFWSVAQRRSYLEALGFAQWLCCHNDGRRAYVLARDARGAAVEACWQPSECATIQKILNPRRWYIAEEESLQEALSDPDVGRTAPWRNNVVGLQHPRHRSEHPAPRVPINDRDALAGTVRRLAIRGARKCWELCGEIVDLEDLVQEAHIATLLVASSSDAAQRHFRKEVWFAIRCALVRYLQDNGAVVRLPRSLGAMPALGERAHHVRCSTEGFHQLHDAPNDGEFEGNLPADVVEALDALRPLEREVIGEHCAGLDFTNAARTLGVSRSRAHQIFSHGIERLKKAVERASARTRHEQALKGRPPARQERGPVPSELKVRQQPRTQSWEELKVAILKVGAQHRRGDHRYGQRWRDQAASRAERRSSI
ncbi:MAG TPA: hypothetical protein VJU61_16835 [Polyangiaceae bacterium]|nr:hypothetical protein [Polyangiaceae bacterium]